MKRILLLASLFLFVLSLGFVLAGEETTAAGPMKTWVTASTIKPVGEVWCDGKQEHQSMAVVATFKDEKGNASEKELAKWDQVTGKECSEAKARGQMPDKPNEKTAAEAKKQAEEGQQKSRGRCSWRPVYYYYWDYGSYLYIEWYDECGNYVSWEIRY